MHIPPSKLCEYECFWRHVIRFKLSPIQDLVVWAAKAFPAAETTSGRTHHMTIIYWKTYPSKNLNLFIWHCLDIQSIRHLWEKLRAAALGGLHGHGPQSLPPQDVATGETLKRCQIIFACRLQRSDRYWIKHWWKVGARSSLCSPAILVAAELQSPPAVGSFRLQKNEGRLCFAFQMWKDSVLLLHPATRWSSSTQTHTLQ